MPRYRYSAARPNGELLQGELEAADEHSLTRMLRDQGLLLLRARPSAPAFSLPSLRRRQTRTGRFFRELATLLGAGMTLDRALGLLATLDSAAEHALLALGLRDRIRQGASLSEAMEAPGLPFSRLQIHMVRAGEAAGDLEGVLDRLAGHEEREQALREELLGALVYPALLLAVSGLSVAGLLLFVLPGFAEMFRETGQPLPPATRLALGLGEALRTGWWMPPVAATLLLGWHRRRMRSPRAREARDARRLRLPLVGPLLRELETARFTRTLGTLLEAGVPLPRAMQLAAGGVENRAMRGALERSREALQRGRGLAAALAGEEALPPLALQLIAVGEQSARLAPVLLRIARESERHVRTRMKRLLALVEPVLVIGLGLLVAGIIATLLAALLDANQLLL